VIVDDEVFVKGGYPSRSDLGSRLNLSLDGATDGKTETSGCCSGADAA